MKILVVASRVYDESLLSPNKAVTGLEIMVRDILDGISIDNDCSIFTTNLPTRGGKIGKFMLLPNRFSACAMAIKCFGLKYFKECFRESKSMTFVERIRLSLTASLLFLYINEFKPDIINLHDLNDWNTIFIKLFRRRDIKILLTDHLYIGSKERSYGYERLRYNEEKIFNYNDGNFYVSFVSNGMRKRFLSDYPSFPAYRTFCVVNGTRLNGKCSESLSKPAVFDKASGKKVLLCIGGFSPRKNQQQIIDAVQLLSKEELSKVCVFFIGGGNPYIIRRKLANTKASQSLIYIGKIPPHEMSSYYHYCDGTITASLNESFGLTIIEGFSYGKPAILFDDIDSFPDIYDEKVCVPVNKRSDRCLAEAIKVFIENTWDADNIRDYANKFSIIKVHQGYIKLLDKIKSQI